jgi:hypothetical protein
MVVERIQEELAPALRDRDLTWEIANLPDVPGDRTLLNREELAIQVALPDVGLLLPQTDQPPQQGQQVHQDAERWR